MRPVVGADPAICIWLDGAVALAHEGVFNGGVEERLCLLVADRRRFAFVATFIRRLAPSTGLCVPDP